MLLALVLGTVPGSAAKRTDPKLTALRTKRSEVSQQRQRAAARVDALKASTSKLAASLQVLSTAEDQQSTLAEEAVHREEQAKQTLKNATTRLAQSKQRLDAAERQRRTAALLTYAGSNATAAADALRLDDINLAWQRTIYLGVAEGFAADRADQLRAAREDHQTALVEAETARHRATVQRQASAARLKAVRNTARQRSLLADAMENRLERALAEADSLASLDAQVSAELSSRQQALIAAIRADDERARARLAAQVRTGKTPQLIPPAPVGRPILKAVDRPTGALSSVYGITIDNALAGPLRNLIDEAAASGINLRGGGYRNPSQQVALRRAHCGTSDFAIYEARASSCRPPTARPGQSMHEQALAIDFTTNGSLITSRGSAAFQWLSANARRFGLQNLPSEPWHWSTNGD